MLGRLFLTVVFAAFSAVHVNCIDNLLVLSIATEETDGFVRYERSLKAYNYPYQILGMGEEWRGGNIKVYAGGGQKINIYKKALEDNRENQDLIIIMTDSYDVIATQEPEKVVEKFKNSGARVLFSAEEVCWPDASLTSLYPEVSDKEKRFLNSGGIIGYASDLYEILTEKAINDDEDDQLYYTLIYLNLLKRNKYQIKLDTKSEIFQNLNGAMDEVKVATLNDNMVIFNSVTEQYPAFLHGNGPTKLILNQIGNYIGKAYDSNGCKICSTDVIELSEAVENWPSITLTVLIESPTPFLREFFQKLSVLNYPKSKITLLIYNTVKYHNKTVEDFFMNPDNEYASIKYLGPDEGYSPFEARTLSMEDCLASSSQFYFALDSTVHLDNPDTLKVLIEQNRGVISPVMIKPGTMWSNVWGAVAPDGYYKRSYDYYDIIQRKTKGVWNLPFVSRVVLSKASVIKRVVDLIYGDANFDTDMVYAKILRDNDIFMYGTNIEYFGHLIELDNFNTSLIRPEMYEIKANYEDWAARYVHEKYNEYLNNNSLIIEPCTDVFWFPLVTDEFCEDMIVMMEHFGDWSAGRNNNSDKRLPGGYENVPTVDIHTKQINWDSHWLFFLEKVMMPMQRSIFTGYVKSPPRALLSFVVRYRPGEQDHLVPHHDASTYTINVALNRPDVDFEGGGCRFTRRNCSVTKTRKGWAMIHPGRFSHQHEGLVVTSGTRYIMVTFVDP